MINTKLCKELYAGSFLMSTKMFMYPPMQKTSVSPAFFTVRPLGEIHIHSPCILIAHCSPPCNLVLHSHFSETLLSGLSVTELMNCFFWYAFLIFLCLCNIYTIEQPFLDGVLSLEDVILCHNCWVQSHNSWLKCIY